jgi:predicted nucleotidyltransferase
MLWFGNRITDDAIRKLHGVSFAVEVKKVEVLSLMRVKMKSIEQIRKQLKDLKPVLEEKFQVETVGVFGSYSRGEQTKKSDVDVLVEFAKDAHVGLFKYVDLEIFLSEQLGVKVDLVAKGGLKPSLKDRILSEVVYV